MRAPFYPEVFSRAGLQIVTPNAEEQALIHDKYINELLKNRFEETTAAAITAVIERMRDEQEIEAIVLAGTELPLLLRGAEPARLTFLDTTLIHVDAAVAWLLSR